MDPSKNGLCAHISASMKQECVQDDPTRRSKKSQKSHLHNVVVNGFSHQQDKYHRACDENCFSLCRGVIGTLDVVQILQLFPPTLLSSGIEVPEDINCRWKCSNVQATMVFKGNATLLYQRGHRVSVKLSKECPMGATLYAIFNAKEQKSHGHIKGC